MFMSAQSDFPAHARSERFLLVHVLLIPIAIATLAVLARTAGLDDAIEAVFFDPAMPGFPARQWPLLEALGHRVAKSAVLGLWLLLLVAAVVASVAASLRAWAGPLWLTVAAMAAGPVLVVLLKNLNGYRCPWDLVQFGGMARSTGGWFVSGLEAGRCFPSGHAAGGFCLVALYFCGLALGHRGLARAGISAALVAGSGFSVVRMLQGAHFLSHNLWSAAIDWCAAALVFAPVFMLRRENAAAPGGAPGGR